jgi:hypothetical protein
MKKKPDTKLTKKMDELRFEILVDDLLIYENWTRRRLT